jgi:uncharacterized membrane protein YjdF
MYNKKTFMNSSKQSPDERKKKERIWINKIVSTIFMCRLITKFSIDQKPCNIMEACPTFLTITANAALVERFPFTDALMDLLFLW